MMDDDQQSAYGLNLADGAAWSILAENPEAQAFISRLAEIMRLSSANGKGRQVLVQVQNGRHSERFQEPQFDSITSFYEKVLADYPWEEECRPLKRNIVCSFHQNGDETQEVINLIHLSSIFALDAVTRGGMLLHGALVERDGKGVILAGPGGVGKSTACERLPESWKVFSDDSALVVRDEFGTYWAHPWPTWSRFLMETVGGSWEVSRGLRLKAVYFLAQSPDLKLTPLGEGEMVCRGMETIEQASRATMQRLDEGNVRKLRNLYFRNVCQMAKAIPSYQLDLDMEGSFWKLLHAS